MSSFLVQKIIETDLAEVSQLFEGKGKIYTFLNPVSYLETLRNRDRFLPFDGIFADGSILVAAIRLCYGKSVTRRSFDMTSIAPELFSYAESHQKNVYIVASKQEQVERAVEVIMEHYPKILIAGYRNGYFSSDAEKDGEARHIAEINPDFLVVGMGVLMQEDFLLRVKHSGYQGIGFTCGGFIHQISKNEIEYYPAWVDRLNLRFVYRMYKEKHTRKRYAKAAFVFPLRFIYERCVG